MPTTSWSTMRAFIARSYGYYSFTSTDNATSDSTIHIQANTIESTELVKRFPNNDQPNNWYVLVEAGTNAGAERRSTDYVAATSLLTFGNPSLTADPAARACSLYQFFSPSEYQDAFNDAVKRMFPSLAIVREDRDIPIRIGQRFYELATNFRRVTFVELTARGNPGTGDGCWLGFDMIDDFVTITNNTAIDNIFDGGGTVEAWIYPRSDGEAGGRILNKRSAGVTGWALLITGESDGKANLQLLVEFGATGTAGVWTASGVLNINQWNHVAVSFDDDSAANDPTMTVNGTIVTVTETVTPVGSYLNESAIDLFIGGDGAGLVTFDGFIQEVRMWSDVRTQAEIETNKNRHLRGVEDGLAGYWPMENGRGLTVTDKSVNSNDGTITGAIWHDNRNSFVVTDWKYQSPVDGAAVGGILEIPSAYIIPTDKATDRLLRVRGIDVLSTVSADTDTFEVDDEMLEVLANETRRILAQEKGGRQLGSDPKWQRIADDYARKVDNAFQEGVGLHLQGRRQVELVDG